jgi:hypothetical protein
VKTKLMAWQKQATLNIHYHSRAWGKEACPRWLEEQAATKEQVEVGKRSPAPNNDSAR